LQAIGLGFKSPYLQSRRDAAECRGSECHLTARNTVQGTVASRCGIPQLRSLTTLGKEKNETRCMSDGTRRALRERVRGGAGLRGEAAERNAREYRGTHGVPCGNAREYRGTHGVPCGNAREYRAWEARENMVKRERVHGGCLGATVRRRPW
jgi:hypothetical protein